MSCGILRLSWGFYRAALQAISVLFLRKGCVYALDDICNPANLVVPGDGQLLHTGWLYPHLAANRCGCPGNKLSNRTARCNLTRAHRCEPTEVSPTEILLADFLGPPLEM